ncbi:MAG: hydantoinase/oxoprolinase family protein [Gammaproteobacteria bacterium]|nr:hydantoinase/oxoprolinase family protein [Gammaproteobacteria bacterium]
MSADNRFVIGVDVGGTFTDVVCSDQTDTWRAKSPTVPSDFGAGVMAACQLVAAECCHGLDELLSRTVRFGLGTTAVTNVFASQTGCRIGLITTAGFEDHFHLARSARHGNDGWLELPWNPLPRDAVVGINERIDREGKVCIELSEEEVEQAARYLAETHQVEAIAISFLWSFLNPEHEQSAADIIRNLCPDVQVFCGSKLNPTLREYDRTREAVLSAYAFGALDGVAKLSDDLRERGLQSPLLLLHSGGGAMSVSEAMNEPLHLAYSGPASGAIAAAEVARRVRSPNAISFDVGGTSVDICVIQECEPERKSGVEADSIGSGLSSVHVGSVGAGGGAIVWVDDRDMLRIGPHSARAEPGPACYGRGGTEPTITDAMLLLGYIDPHKFIGGSMKLDTAAAQRAFDKLGQKIGMTTIEAAHGAREVAIVEMARPVRGRLATAGIDPRKYSLISFGGSGSLFAPEIARELNVPVTFSPKLASVLSAFGASSADLRRERIATLLKIFPVKREEIESRVDVLRQQVSDDLALDGVRAESQSIRFEVEVRILKQKASVCLPLPNGCFDSAAILESFIEIHESRYGKGTVTPNSQIELSLLRAIGTGVTERASFPSDVANEGRGEFGATESRPVWINKEQAEVPVFTADLLCAGDVIAGPALVDAPDTSVWVPANAQLIVERGQTLKITDDLDRDRLS